MPLSSSNLPDTNKFYSAQLFSLAENIIRLYVAFASFHSDYASGNNFLTIFDVNNGCKYNHKC